MKRSFEDFSVNRMVLEAPLFYYKSDVRIRSEADDALWLKIPADVKNRLQIVSHNSSAEPNRRFRVIIVRTE